MKNMKNFFAIALSLSLILNVFSLIKINNINLEMQRISNNYQHLFGTVSHQSGNMNNVINNAIRELREDQRWITPIKYDIGEIKDETVNLDFSWQIKEIGQNAKVYFNYKEGANGEYQTVPVVAKNQGLFEISRNFEVEIEPPVHINISWSTGSMERETKAVALKEERIITEGKDGTNHIYYFISVEEGDTTKSSEIEQTNLSQISYRIYNPIAGNLNFLDKDRINLHIFEDAYVDHLKGIADVYLNIYNDNRLLSKEKLESTSEERGFFTFTQAKDQKFEFSRLELEVIYENGEMFKKDIY